jgi:hexosaminidase
MKKNSISVFVLASLIISVVVACNSKTPTDLTKVSIIPKPLSVTSDSESFTLATRTDILVPEGREDLVKIGQYLADILNRSTGLGLDVVNGSQKPGKGDIQLVLSEDDAGLGDEGYELKITKKLLTVTANKPAGLFYGIQTIRQLLPARIEMDTLQEGPWEIATGTIRDYPYYAYRGAMRDVVRHFFGVDDIKLFIDQIAAYKMNVLHMHLTDDQGWRIEIQSWPNLAAHGGKTEVGGGEGGFYTQEEYAEIVKYAGERFITVIPEIDMPGHTNAALSSYPELNIGGKATELYTGTRVGFSTLDTRSETTYRFVDDVIRELAALTPGPYIHIGGDESDSTRPEDYISFVNRVQDIVIFHGKQVLGWDEIALATLKPNAIVQYWAKADNAIKGVKQNAKVLMSPARYAYLDMKYDSTSTYGYDWAGYIEVDDAYNWDPETLVPEIKKENIIGIEAPLWSETVSDRQQAEYLLFPRLPGYAEIGWTQAGNRNWDEYRVRLSDHGARMKAMGISFYPSKYVDWKRESSDPDME